MKWLIAILSALLASTPVFAQKTVKVEAEYTFVVPENMTIEQAKTTALDRVKIQAIADEFGTIVSQSNSTYVENQNGYSDIRFQSLGGSDVKGEWIETIGDPIYDIGYEQEMLVVKVIVKGRIREIKTSKVDLMIQILCNGTEPRFERSDFSSGDDLYLRFQSPTDGYLVVYLVDHTSEAAYCLLPYSQSSDAAQKIEHDRQYVFFSEKEAAPDFRDEVDEYCMTGNGEIERNDIFVIFSPNEFTKANNRKIEESRPRELPEREFHKWLAEIWKFDNKLQIHNQSITIKN